MNVSPVLSRIPSRGEFSPMKLLLSGCVIDRGQLTRAQREGLDTIADQADKNVWGWTVRKGVTLRDRIPYWKVVTS